MGFGQRNVGDGQVCWNTRMVRWLHQDGVLEHQDGAYARMACWNVTPGLSEYTYGCGLGFVYGFIVGWIGFYEGWQ